jgi:uncharacterized damage-inducible protein DinB
MGPADLDELYRHMEWADSEIWRAVLATPAARSDETLRRLLLHLHVVQRAFLNLWESRPVTFPDLASFADAFDIHAWAQPYYAAAQAFINSADAETLRRPVHMPWAGELGRQLGFPPATPTVGETMLQVAMHSTYHRGQINVRLREVGGEPPLVDYIAWIWFGRPAYGSPVRRPPT